jgi:SAM-dependent methyltransferase
MKVLPMPFSKDPTSYLNNCPNRAVHAFHLFGEGIEIGALAWPLSLPRGVRCRYVDVVPTEELKRIYGEYRDLIIPVDVLDDGQSLNSLGKESQDFIIANHVLEHVVNVIRSLQRWYEVLKPNGILYLALPDWRFTADQVRLRTPLAHLQKEFQENLAEIPIDHCIENLIAWNGVSPEKIDAAMISKCRKDGVHNHCWQGDDLIELLLYLHRNQICKFQLADVSLPKGIFNEFILILRKDPMGDDFWTAYGRAKYNQEVEIERRILSLSSRQKAAEELNSSTGQT